MSDNEQESLHAQLALYASQVKKLRELVRDYQEWAKEGVEAPTACNYQVWEMRYAILAERARELMGNGDMK